MRRAPLGVLLLAACGLQGCSSWWAGTAIGGATGIVGPAAAAIDVEHRGSGCPDLASQGSVKVAGVKLSCVYDPATGRTTEQAEIASFDPETVLLRSIDAQAAQAKATADLIAALAPLLAKIAGTAAGGPLGGAAAGLLYPDLPTLPGPAGATPSPTSALPTS